jgi:hypothetical protein
MNKQKTTRAEWTPEVIRIITHLLGDAPEGCLAAPITARGTVGYGAQFSQATPASPLRPAATVTADLVLGEKGKRSKGSQSCQEEATRHLALNPPAGEGEYPTTCGIHGLNALGCALNGMAEFGCWNAESVAMTFQMASLFSATAGLSVPSALRIARRSYSS